MSGRFLLGFDNLVAAQVVRRKEKAKTQIKTNEPDKVQAAQIAVNALEALIRAESKIDAVIRTAIRAEAQALNGKSAMVAEAEQDVLLRIVAMTAAQIQLNEDNEALAVKSAAMEVKRAELESAANVLNTAFLAWRGTDASEAAKKLEGQISLMTTTAYALARQISDAPAMAGDEMAVHLSKLGLWMLRMQESLTSYSTARGALPVGVLPQDISLAEAGEAMVAAASSAVFSADDFVLTAGYAQKSSEVASNAQAQLDGANAALAALNATGSPRGALTGAAKEREEEREKASRAARVAAMAALTQAMRQRVADDP